MSVLVNTPIWSAVFRRGTPDEAIIKPLRQLVEEGRAHLLGMVRQEVLSGIRSTPQFVRLRQALRGFPDFPVTREDHERAAEFYNSCRSHGVQGSGTDLLLWAVAERAKMRIYTTDKDFLAYARFIPAKLFRTGH